MKTVKDYVTSIPDFPEPGIIFRDITSVIGDADGLKLAVDQMQEKLEERRQQFEQQGQEAFAKEYSQIYGIVMELLDKIVEVLGDEKMTLAEYQEILEAGFAEASVGIIPPTADQVLIGDNERSRL